MKISKHSKAVKQTDKDNMHGDHVATCLCCVKAYYSEGSPGYSEMTPGEPAGMYCTANHWCFDDALNTNLIVFMHEAGRRCVDFEPRES